MSEQNNDTQTASVPKPVTRKVQVRLSKILTEVSPSEDRPRMFYGVGVGTFPQRGKSILLECSNDLFKRIRGKVTENSVHSDLRKMHWAQIVADCTVVGNGNPRVESMDLFPARLYPKGSCPVNVEKAKKEGITIEWDQDLNGFMARETYDGLDDITFIHLLDELRKARGGDKKKLTIRGHVCTEVDNVTWKIVPTGAK